MIIGKNMIIAIGGKVIGASRECSIDISRDMIEVAKSATARDYRPGRYSFKISASGLYEIGDNTTVKPYSMASTLIAGTKVAFAYECEDKTTGKTDIFSGYAFVESLKMSGSCGSLSSYAISLQGSGEITNSQETRDELTIDPLFCAIYTDGREGPSYSSGESIEMEKEDLITDISGGEGFTLRVYPRMKNRGVNVSDIRTYISQFITSVRCSDKDTGYEMQVDDVITSYSDHVDIKISQQQWQELLFSVDLYPASDYGITFALHD